MTKPRKKTREELPHFCKLSIPNRTFFEKILEGIDMGIE